MATVGEVIVLELELWHELPVLQVAVPLAPVKSALSTVPGPADQLERPRYRNKPVMGSNNSFFFMIEIF